MDPDSTLAHHRRNLVRLGKELKRKPAHEINDQLMRRLLGLEAPLHAQVEIFGAFFGDLKARRDDFKWFRFFHIVCRMEPRECRDISWEQLRS